MLNHWVTTGNARSGIVAHVELVRAGSSVVSSPVPRACQGGGSGLRAVGRLPPAGMAEAGREGPCVPHCLQAPPSSRFCHFSLSPGDRGVCIGSYWLGLKVATSLLPVGEAQLQSHLRRQVLKAVVSELRRKLPLHSHLIRKRGHPILRTGPLPLSVEPKASSRLVTLPAPMPAPRLFP